MTSPADSWLFWALLSAIFAALTAIFAKVGIENVNSDFATFIRTIVILVAAGGIVLALGKWQSPGSISPKTWFFLLLSGCASLPQRPAPPTVAEIVKMAADKTPAQDIIQRMRDAGAVYRLSASQLARLREQGVPDEVIDYMQGTWLNEVQRDAAARLFPYEPWPPGLGPLYGPSYWPYYGPYGRSLRRPWFW